MATEFPAHPFWDFSLHVYATEEVRVACLGLQQRHELDVNIVLFCIWLGVSGRGQLNAAEMDRTCQAVAPWHHQVVRGLRAARNAMRDGLDPAPRDLSDAMRKQILRTEVECEHVEQLMLAATAASMGDTTLPAPARLSDAAANIACYYASFGAALSDDDRRECAVLLARAFPDAKFDEIDAALAGSPA